MTEQAKKPTRTRKPRTTNSKSKPSIKKSFKLSAGDRANLVHQVLGVGKGSLLEILKAKGLMSMFEFTENEKKEMGYVEFPDGRVVWNAKKAKDRSFQLDDAEVTLIQMKIRLIGSEGNIPMTLAFAGLIDTFFSEKEQQEILEELEKAQDKKDE